MIIIMQETTLKHIHLLMSWGVMFLGVCCLASYQIETNLGQILIFMMIVGSTLLVENLIHAKCFIC